MELVYALEQRIRKGLHQVRQTIELGIWITFGAMFSAAIFVGFLFFATLFTIWLFIPFALAACIPAFGSFLYAMYKVYVEILKKRYLLIKRYQRDQDENGDNTCIVCLDRENNTAILPCGHDKFCHDCALRCQSAEDFDPRCPVCRGVIVHVWKFPSSAT